MSEPVPPVATETHSETDPDCVYATEMQKAIVDEIRDFFSEKTPGQAPPDMVVNIAVATVAAQVFAISLSAALNGAIADGKRSHVSSLFQNFGDLVMAMTRAAVPDIDALMRLHVEQIAERVFTRAQAESRHATHH